jgi:RND family efflux transporter MFP subunit
VARAGIESDLSFKVQGTIQKLSVKVGDRVSLGQLIAQLDPVDYELQVEEARAALGQAVAQARNAAADLERVRALFENNNASRDDLDAARAAADSARAQVRATEKRLELSQRQVSYTSLAASMAGAIAEVNVEVNENVRAGQSIVRLTSGLEPEVEVAIPEVLITQIEEGDSVRVNFDAIADAAFPAVVTEVGVASTEFATTFPVLVRLRQANPDVRPGMVAEVEFVFETTRSGPLFLVPPSAVGEDEEGRFVYLLKATHDERGLVHRQPVTIGQLTAEGLEVLRGLSEGDRVVTAGVSKIEDGQEVKVP